MEKSRIRLGLLFIVLVPALVKCQEMNSYVSEDGELITIPASLPKPDVSAMMESNGTCLKVKTIVYYENYFRDGWVGQGNDPIARIQSIMDSVEISLLTNLGYDVNFDIEAIEHHDGVYTASNVPASSIIASDGRNPDTWVFLAYENDTTGHTASAPDIFCNGWYGVYEAYDYSGGNSDANLVNLLQSYFGNRFDIYFTNNLTCLEDCNSSSCADVACSSILDINSNPYQCLSEEEAQNWHKKCLPSSEKYCRYTGEYDECEWTGWLDQDNPSGYGDYEPVPEGCKVQKYQVQEVSGGTIYDNVSDMSQCLIDSPYVACINSHQGSDCHKIGPISPTLSPLRKDDFRNLITDQNFCKDYRVKYCCGKPKPKCYCCPPELPVNECQDTGCKAYLNGLGECVDVTNPAWDDLDYIFDLSKAVQGKPAADLCSSSLDTSCCRCMKMKTCKDNGCEASFGGNGVCIDNVDGDFSKYDLDMTVKPNPTPGLCSNDVNDHCCSCFKKQDLDSGCYKVKCYHKGLEGICIGKNDPYPVGYTRTEVKCEEKGDCRCWIPCKDIWSKKKCKKEAKKGKCNKEEIAANCCDTCQAYLA